MSNQTPFSCIPTSKMSTQSVVVKMKKELRGIYDHNTGSYQQYYAWVPEEKPKKKVTPGEMYESVFHFYKECKSTVQVQPDGTLKEIRRGDKQGDSFPEKDRKSFATWEDWALNYLFST